MDGFNAFEGFEFIGDDEELPDYSFMDDGSDESPPEGYDIPDLPSYLQGLDPSDLRLSKDEIQQIWEEEISRVATFFDSPETEEIPGISRSLLSRKKKYGPSFGAMVCRSLAKDLKNHYEGLLFGLTDGIYLHCTRSSTFDSGRVSAGVRFFWSDEVTPYPLIVPNVVDIVENEELTYLAIGDLLEDFLDGLENGGKNESGGGEPSKPPRKT